MFVVLVFNTFVHFLAFVNSVPSYVCNQPFRWDDCGQPPTPVMYYWKPGSRCEIALWRGCLPNLNMFKDEYDCSATCIFTPFARADDYHMDENEIGTEAYEFIDYQYHESTTGGTRIDTTVISGNKTTGAKADGPGRTTSGGGPTETQGGGGGGGEISSVATGTGGGDGGGGASTPAAATTPAPDAPAK